MNFIDFREAFSKIARKSGMGEVIDSTYVCHIARCVVQEKFAELECDVLQYKDGLLTLGFPNSSALTAFSHIKGGFITSLKEKLTHLPANFEVKLWIR